MAYEYTENLSSTPRSDIPGKASGKRKKHPFKVKRNGRNKDDVPQFLPTRVKYRRGGDTEVLHPYRKQALDDNPVMKATTARNNDGMSFVW